MSGKAIWAAAAAAAVVIASWTTVSNSQAAPRGRANQWINPDDIDAWTVGLFCGNPANAGFVQGPKLEGGQPGTIVFDSAGNATVTCGTFIERIGTDGTARVLAGTPGLAGSADGPPWQAAFAGAGPMALLDDDTLFVVDSVNFSLRKLTRTDKDTWVTTTVAGRAGQLGHADGPGADARFTSPFDGIAVDRRSGAVYLMDGDWLRKFQDGKVTTLNAGTGYENGPLAKARFERAMGGGSCLAIDDAGDLYVADRWNMAIRKIDLAKGEVSTIAGREPGAPGGGPFDHADALAARFHPGGGPCTIHFVPVHGFLVTKSADEGGFRRIQDGWMKTFGCRGKSLTGPAAQAAGGGPCGVDAKGNVYIGGAGCIRVMTKVGKETP